MSFRSKGKISSGLSMGDLNAYPGSSLEGDSWDGAAHPVRYSVSNPPPQLDPDGSMKSSINRGKNGNKRKKLPSQKFQQLPPMDLSAEKKIEELQRSAKMPLSNISPRLLAENSISSTMTGTEAEFLARQSIASETSQILAQAAPALQQAPDLSSSNGHNNIIVEALKGKIQALERQAVSLNAIIQKKESELEKKDNKMKSIQIEYEKHRKDTVNDFNRLQSDVSSPPLLLNIIIWSFLIIQLFSYSMSWRYCGYESSMRRRRPN